MTYCLKCKGTGRILEKRISEYLNSSDYYPVACPNCEKTQLTATHRNIEQSLSNK